MSRKKMLVNDSAARQAATLDDELGDLYARPGFLLRRAHQIAVGIFVEECTAVGLTPPQHSVLIMIDRCPTLDQASLARAIGFDRATVGQIVEGLEARRLLRRGISSKDRRRKALALTRRGQSLIKRAAGSIRRTSERLLAPLRPAERALFIRLLQRLTGELNSKSRTPVRPPEGG
jgi:MarR family transcriptional regulator, lower aerobic nicotinate degradation pathway regulator